MPSIAIRDGATYRACLERHHDQIGSLQFAYLDPVGLDGAVWVDVQPATKTTTIKMPSRLNMTRFLQRKA